jgi:hypothetical protein
LPQPVKHEVGADKARAARNQNHETPLYRYRGNIDLDFTNPAHQGKKSQKKLATEIVFRSKSYRIFLIHHAEV